MPLPSPLLDDLGRVWLTHRNRRWLFPNRHGDAPLNRRTLSGSFADAAVAACLPSGATPHTLRHSYRNRKTGRQCTCRLGGDQFIRRFLQHVLPRGSRPRRPPGRRSNPGSARGVTHGRLIFIRTLARGQAMGP